MPPSPELEFVTIAEAAKALGISERQARRLAATLTATDKGQDSKRQHKGLPVAVVRYSAVEALFKSEAVREKTTGKAIGNSAAMPLESSGVSVEMSVEVAARIATAEQRAAVAEARAELLEAERDRLDKLLVEALAIARAAQDQERAGRLLGSSRTPVQIEASAEGSNLRSGLTESPQAQESGIGGGIAPPSQTEEPRRKFWSWLRRVW